MLQLHYYPGNERARFYKWLAGRRVPLQQMLMTWFIPRAAPSPRTP